MRLRFDDEGNCYRCGSARGVHNGGVCPSGPITCTYLPPRILDALGVCVICKRKPLDRMTRTEQAVAQWAKDHQMPTRHEPLSLVPPDHTPDSEPVDFGEWSVTWPEGA